MQVQDTDALCDCCSCMKSVIYLEPFVYVFNLLFLRNRYCISYPNKETLYGSYLKQRQYAHMYTCIVYIVVCILNSLISFDLFCKKRSLQKVRLY